MTEPIVRTLGLNRSFSMGRETVVALDGVEARIEHCAARRCPLCRPLQLVTRTDAPEEDPTL